MSEPSWHEVGAADDASTGTLRRVEVGETAVCLARTEDGWLAFDDTCTHEECSLAEGELDGGVVICPCHGSEFDVRTGDVVTPPALDPLPIYEARDDGGTLFVRLAPPPLADAAVHARDDHVPHSPSSTTVPGPSLDGLVLDDVDLTDLDVWERGVPYDWLALLRRDAPLFWQPEREGRGFWVLTRYDDVVRVLRDPTVSRDIEANARFDPADPLFTARRERRSGAKTILNLDPPDHTRLRRLVSKAFTPSAVERLRAWMTARVDTVLDSADRIVHLGARSRKGRGCKGQAALNCAALGVQARGPARSSEAQCFKPGEVGRPLSFTAASATSPDRGSV